MNIMVEYSVLEALDNLAERYIPEGQHELLHVNSREVWKDMMIQLIERKAVPLKLSYFTRCAVSWEALLTNRYITLN